ncbi:MAG: trigger factor [Fimbriimonadaceae bacterium]|nr:trigger factor [Fimbriimonadaceae bacterium]
MQVTREDLNPCTIKLTVVCGEDQVREGFDKAYKQFAKRIKVPGFRPGHAPKHMVAQSIPKDDLYDSAADNIVRAAFRDALKEQELEPASQPSVELTLINEEEAKCEFSVKVPLAPVVELGEYKGLAAGVPPVDVTDEDIDHQIEELRKRKSTREAITDRGVQDGDVTVVNIKIDGEAGEGRTFMTIAGQTFPQLDKALSGMKAEEVKVVELTFPDNFQEADWKGKKEKCHVTVRSLSSVKLPEVDDEFAQTLQADSVDALRARMRELLSGAKEQMAIEFLNEQLLEALLGSSTIHVPDTMWEQVASRRLYELAVEQQDKGKSMEAYATEQGMTVAELEESWRNEAKMHVTRAVAIQEIFKREKMELTNADLNMQLVSMASEYEVKPEEMLEILKKNKALDELQFRAVFHKVANFLRDNAVLSEMSLEGDQRSAAPKKSRSKKKSD